jgi:hypothetical protein
VIDCVRVAGAQPDWQYHIALLLPEDAIDDAALLKIYQVVEHELRRAAELVELPPIKHWNAEHVAETESADLAGAVSIPDAISEVEKIAEEVNAAKEALARDATSETFALVTLDIPTILTVAQRLRSLSPEVGE